MATVEPRVAPLLAGDFLSREEFLRRWEEHPEIKRAELIGGVVYMPSPLSLDHGSAENDTSTWLGVYKANTPVTASANNATTFLLDDTLQPDLNLMILPEFGGRSRRQGKYLGGIPEHLTEICQSSAAYDLHQKLELYQAAKIPEYLAILLFEQEIRWHVLEKGKYRLLPPDTDGIWRSRVFPGLWLDGKALLAGNLAHVLAKLNEGLATPEHQAFVDKLRAKRRK